MNIVQHNFVVLQHHFKFINIKKFKNMKTKFQLPLMAMVFLAGALFFAGCEKDKKANNDLTDMSVSNILFTSCQSHRNPNQKGHYNPDSVSVQVIDGTIFVNHFNLEVNCGFN